MYKIIDMNRNAQTMMLHDGRVLGFAEYGDPKGPPLFYFHGWPASRLAAEKYHLLAQKLHIRIIAPDRPGYGLSDFQKDRVLLSWPDDVIELADRLQVQKFSVMGVSGGGPYAAVCAFKIPKRIIRTGIIVGLSPIYGPRALDGVMWMAKFAWTWYDKWGIVRKLSAISQYLNARWEPSWGLYRYLFGAKTDRSIYRDAGVRQAARRNFQEAFRQGYKGPELDLKLYTMDWGFDLRDIVGKTYLWYGTDDQNVSLNMGKYYAKEIPKSKLILYPGEGHLISVTHAEEIFKTLLT